MLDSPGPRGIPTMRAPLRAPSSAALLALAAACAAPLASCGGDEPAARAYRIETRDQWVGGPAADAFEGDFLLENEHIRAAVLSARCVEGADGQGEVCGSPGPGVYGGSLVDLDLRRQDARYASGRGKDQFAELFDTVNLDVMATRTVSILADGSDGGPAIVRAEGPAGNFITYIQLIGDLLSLADTWQFTDYILKPGAPYVTVRTTAVVWTGAGQEGIEPPPDPCGWAQGDPGLPCDATVLPPADGALSLLDGLNSRALQFGDFFLAGGDVDVFAPGIGFDEDKAVAAGFEAGENSIVTPFAFPYLAAAGDGVSYAVGTGGTISVPLFTSSQTAVFGAAVPAPVDQYGEPTDFPEGQVYTYERFVGVGRGDVGSAHDALMQAWIDRGLAVPYGTVTGRVIEEGSLSGLSSANVLAYRDTGAPRDGDGLPPLADLYTAFGTDPGEDSVPDGSFSGRLPVGSWLLVAKAEGRPASAPVSATVADGATVETGLVVPRTASLSVSIVDDRGLPLPAKVSVLPAGGAPDPGRSELGDHYVAGGVSRVVFAPYGEAEIDLPAGDWEVVVSRGPEYGLWRGAVEGGSPAGIPIAPGRPVHLDVVLPREVDSTGFIAADLHVHAAPSHDVGVPLDLRVVTMACEGVEFLTSNDHDVLTDYRPVIDDLSLNPWVQGAVGLETTTIEVGHFLGFPLAIDYDKPQEGAFDWTAMSPSQIVSALRALGDPGADESVVFVGHPRDGILGYFDQYGVDPFLATEFGPVLVTSLLSYANPLLSDTSYFTLDFDGLELLNGKRLEIVRTPTQEEMDCYAAQQEGEAVEGCDAEVSMYDMLARTTDEQARLDDLSQPFYLNRDLQGQVDDWFMLLNLGFRHTALGNSDTHSTTTIESGCPRNYVVSDVDDPELVDARDVALAVKEHRVVASYGPLVDFWADEPGNGIGSDVAAQDGQVTLHVEVQAPRWMDVDRVELYENGRMVREWTAAAGEVDPSAVYKLQADHTAHPVGEDGAPADAWYVVVALGEGDLSPMFTPVDVPPIQLNDVVVGALSGLDLGAIPVGDLVGPTPQFPRRFPVHPYALTNPIWVDVDGDRDGDGSPFEPLGKVPGWFRGTPEE